MSKRIKDMHYHHAELLTGDCWLIKTVNFTQVIECSGVIVTTLLRIRPINVCTLLINTQIESTAHRTEDNINCSQLEKTRKAC